MSAPAVDFCYVPGGPVSEVAMLAALGEQLGFRCIWIPDQGFYRDPFLLAGVAAAATSRIDIGIGITMPMTRHPVQIARAAATLDEMSGHRLRLGLGSGNIEHVVKPLGLPTRDTVERVRTGVQEIRALLSGESIRYTDSTHRTVALDFKPERVMPIYIGARGPRMLAMAGEVADGVLMESLFNADGIPHALERVAAGRPRGAGPLDIVAWQVVVATDDQQREIDVYRPWISRILQGGPVEALVRVGVAEETVRTVRAAAADGRTSDAVAAVTDDAVRCLVMVGSEAELVERFIELGSRGCTAISVLSTKGVAETAANLTRIGTSVLPALV
ncbi:LLM class flavin-dependent oxidoreductase [Pseudonocardia thermophila]|jgi:Coenzyme F420-dependent N5,N10-methylene tetrahydromethanopterin reductase and related flavin-dependent oxidoreductases|uniref:LLM class flavin-dependent oxidoreductase n=1 Tax=Pseudonocardia thermophila TaxID=1848 RepID=UPI00248E409F|nr:LLM class flavin-dependent oxidoreductase [Pseudonocardia thermophila]